MLENSNEYIRLDNDPFNSLEKTQISITNELSKKKYIIDKQRKFLRQPPSNIPRIHGYPKIHKEQIPLRPVVSTLGSPAYNLSKFAANILNAIKNKEYYNVCNTKEFLDKIKDIDIDSNYTMISLDVKSLYTSVSHNLAMNILQEKWNDISQHTPLDSTLFFKIIKFCITNAAVVKFEDTVYKQTKGLAMGSSLSGVIADIVLDHIIKQIFEANAFDIKCFVKYVDDLFFIINRDDIEDLFQVFNSAHKDFEFTIETEENGQIPFLDVNLIRSNDKIIHKWYKKPTNMGR